MLLTPQNVGLVNPVATLKVKKNLADVKQFIGNFEFEYKIPFVKRSMLLQILV